MYIEKDKHSTLNHNTNGQFVVLEFKLSRQGIIDTSLSEEFEDTKGVIRIRKLKNRMAKRYQRGNQNP